MFLKYRKQNAIFNDKDPMRRLSSRYLFAFPLVFLMATSCVTGQGEAPTLRPDSAAKEIANMHLRAVRLSKIITSQKKAMRVFIAEIGRMHQEIDRLCLNQGWSIEEAFEKDDRISAKKALKANKAQRRQLNWKATRSLRKASRGLPLLLPLRESNSERETILECYVVLSDLHSFGATSPGDSSRKILLNGGEEAWAEWMIDYRKKKKRNSILYAAGGAGVIGFFYLYLTLIGGFFVA